MFEQESTIPRTTIARSRLANAVKAGEPARGMADRRRDFAAAKIRDAIERALATAPPLTPEQADHLARLLRGGAK